MIDKTTLICPRCRADLNLTAIDELRCPNDGLRFACIDGVWRFLLPERAAAYEQFISEYETVRRAEGRGVGGADYYRALPYFDLSERMSADCAAGVVPAALRTCGTTPHGWDIRAVSFDAFFAQVFRPLERRSAPLTVLDLGAGNGWLSNRLASRGHHLAAVDLLANDFDGLGCHRYFEHRFMPIQAEFERLPFRDAAADLVIFNASLHYSTDFGVTLAEALRVLAPEGQLVILDSPFYHDANSGVQMVQEREESFLKQFGFRSNALPSKNYLTYNDLKELGSTLNLHWQILTPFYGLPWLLRPLKASLLRRREPAKFHVVVGKR
jgi:SAM-dependent methyltransferase